jgi:hypothetical protein
MLDTIPSGTVRKSALSDRLLRRAERPRRPRGDGHRPRRRPDAADPEGRQPGTGGDHRRTDVDIGAGDTIMYRQGTTWSWVVPEGGPMSILSGVAFGGSTART